MATVQAQFFRNRFHWPTGHEPWYLHQLYHSIGRCHAPTAPGTALEDGALHAEKFYRTASEEFATARQAFRWRYLVGLARVTASAFGQPAPGHAEACRLLKV